MMSTATSSDPDDGSPTGTSRTETPPWRSRPSTGLFPDTTVATNAPIATTTVTTR
jgi:hypothetical protein